MCIAGFICYSEDLAKFSIGGILLKSHSADLLSCEPLEIA